jgi:hypothetical protein
VLYSVNDFENGNSWNKKNDAAKENMQGALDLKQQLTAFSPCAFLFALSSERQSGKWLFNY